MMSVTMDFSLHNADNHAVKIAIPVSCKNGSDGNLPSILKYAHLACVAVQHEGIKQEKYDASLYFFGALDSVVDDQHVYGVREMFSGIAETPKSTIEYEQRANTLIHNKYYCDRNGCK